MPYQKLISLTKFSELRIKQLWDDARIFVAHYAELSRGKKHFWKSGIWMTKRDLIKKFGKVRGLLWALNFEPKLPQKRSYFKELFILAWPIIKKEHNKYKGKVTKT